MNNQPKFRTAASTIGFFGVCVVTSGLYRFLSADGGGKGLWFGIVMGSVALASSFVFLAEKTRLANLLAGVSLSIVGGWFFYEALIKKGLAAAEPRQLIILAVTICCLITLLYLQPPTSMKDSSVEEASR